MRTDTQLYWKSRSKQALKHYGELIQKLSAPYYLGVYNFRLKRATNIYMVHLSFKTDFSALFWPVILENTYKWEMLIFILVMDRWGDKLQEVNMLSWFDLRTMPHKVSFVVS